MNSLPVVAAFVLAFLIAAWMNGRLAKRVPQWSVRRRVISAALPVPGAILIATLIGVGWYLAGPGSDENMRDLAAAVVTGMGALFAAVTLAGGLIGAVLVEKGQRS